jgi:hypothetical protein
MAPIQVQRGLRTGASGLNRACLGSNRMHAKVLLMSQADGLPYVSFVTTANWDHYTGSNDWNSAVVTYNNSAIYNGMVTWFNDMWNWASSPYPISVEQGWPQGFRALMPERALCSPGSDAPGIFFEIAPYPIPLSGYGDFTARGEGRGILWK